MHRWTKRGVNRNPTERGRPLARALEKERYAIRQEDQPPPPRLVRIVYVSASVRDLEQCELDAIACAAARNNAAGGLTGLLLYGGSRFYGVLEGPRRRVFNRMERIVVDPRHRNLVVLREEAIETPRFANWSFGSIPDPEPTPSGGGALDSLILRLAGRL